MAPAKPTTLYLTPELKAAVQQRGAQSEIIRRDLGRYYGLIARAKRELREMFTVDELSLIADTLNGSILCEERVGNDLLADVADAIHLDAYDKKWEVDGPALLEKLQAIQYDARGYALADAVEFWWQRVSRGDDPSREDILR